MGADECDLPEGIDEVSAFVRSFIDAITQKPGDFGRFAHRFLHGHPREAIGRNRDIFLICRISIDIGFDWPLLWSEGLHKASISFADLALAKSSFLYGEVHQTSAI